MAKLAIIATTALAASGDDNSCSLKGMSEPGCARSLSNGADVLNVGRLIFSDSASASANETRFRDR
jgi:hypothetical protein